MNMVSYCACIWGLKTANANDKGAVYHSEPYHSTSHKVQNDFFQPRKKREFLGFCAVVFEKH